MRLPLPSLEMLPQPVTGPEAATRTRPKSSGLDDGFRGNRSPNLGSAGGRSRDLVDRESMRASPFAGADEQGAVYSIEIERRSPSVIESVSSCPWARDHLADLVTGDLWVVIRVAYGLISSGASMLGHDLEDGQSRILALRKRTRPAPAGGRIPSKLGVQLQPLVTKSPWLPRP